ncbi:MAG TPA: DNA primase [Kofleriaceae bacterium]|jgi:DNA primase|nr:DNA primase [Kofleriaceae bacterium]
MIPDDVIAQIRDAADIVAVIGQHVQLRRAGTSFKGLCPFHGEKTPSFNVVPAKQFFHCFGCQKHGDVFSFVMELEGKSFVEVAEQLAGRYGITIPRIEESPELQRARGERLRMLEINKQAAAFYRELLADPRRGEPGRAYLARRGVTAETAERFQLGYAPAEWGALADHLKAQRADLEIAVKLGLIAHRPRASGFYDRNRDRLVCPVIVPGGDVVGFSSRLVSAPVPGPDGGEPPKYINSPESAVYKKGKLLFGLAQARDAMHTGRRAVLVEGNFDVISLHQAGFTEVVAPLGTALTPEQLHVLKRLAERVVLLYDGDRAGYKATMHALHQCVEADVEVLVASRPGHARSGGAGILSGGVDPDSLVASGGATLLREAVDRAQGGIEFFIYEVWGKAAANNEGARARALGEAAPLVAKIANPIQRDLIVGTLAAAMNVDEKVVRAALARTGGPQTGHSAGAGRAPGSGPGSDRGPGGPPGLHPNAPSPQQEAATSATGGPVAPPPTEELEVIALLADHPALIATAESDKAFWLLTDARLRDMYSRAREGQSFLELAPVQLPPPLAKHVLSGKYAHAKDPASSLAAMTRNLEARKAGVGLVNLKNSLADARRRGDHELARMLALRAVAERRGDHELAARLADEVHAGSRTENRGPSDPETSNRKQVE